MLEEGQRKDWFESDLVGEAAFAALAGIVVFIARELMTERPFLHALIAGFGGTLDPTLARAKLWPISRRRSVARRR